MPSHATSAAVPSLIDPVLYRSGAAHSVWRKLRRERPVHWHDAAPRAAFWAVTGYHDGRSVLRDWNTFSSTGGTLVRSDMSAPFPGAGTMLVLTDPPKHDVIRRAMARLFTRRAVDRLAARARYRVTAVLDAALGAGDCDFVADVAARIPMAVASELLGMPDDAGDLAHAVTVAATTLDGVGAQEAHLEIIRHYAALIADPSACPAGSMPAALLDAGDDLTLEEMVLACDNVLVAAAETTQHAAASGLFALIEHPAQWRRLKEGTVSVASAVEEILRWASPAAHVMRTATREVTLAGSRIQAGDPVVVWLASANRDGSVFARGDELDLARRPNPHLAFGAGPHFCLGAMIARLVLGLLLEELVRRVDEVILTGEPRRLASYHVLGFESLPVRLQNGSTSRNRRTIP